MRRSFPARHAGWRSAYSSLAYIPRDTRPKTGYCEASRAIAGDPERTVFLSCDSHDIKRRRRPIFFSSLNLFSTPHFKFSHVITPNISFDHIIIHAFCSFCSSSAKAMQFVFAGRYAPARAIGSHANHLIPGTWCERTPKNGTVIGQLDLMTVNDPYQVKRYVKGVGVSHIRAEKYIGGMCHMILRLEQL
jgi:hypothetical protein